MNKKSCSTAAAGVFCGVQVFGNGLGRTKKLQTPLPGAARLHLLWLSLPLTLRELSRLYVIFELYPKKSKRQCWCVLHKMVFNLFLRNFFFETFLSVQSLETRQTLQ
jgi:hypothetical protein